MIPVIIPVYLGGERLKRCTDAVAAQTEVKTELFLRNNDLDNVLYTRAVNEGLRLYLHNPDVEYYLILTQDCYLRPGCLFLLKRHMEANPRAAICAPAQLNEKGDTTWAGSLDCWPYGVHVQNKLSDFAGRASQTYWANGACFLLRKSAAIEAGLLDENMRFICSDSDYSLTLRSRGWDILMVPDAQCEHTADESGKVSSPWLQEIKRQDAIYFTKKWLSGDLFRQISYEGKNITHEHAREFLSRLRQTAGTPADTVVSAGTVAPQ